LNEGYEGRWTGRGGPVAWPARCSGSNPLQFSL
jgi:hypothetical protein